MFSVTGKTGRMSAVETRQMYSIKTGQRPVSPVDIFLVSAKAIYLVSPADICPVSTADIRPVSAEDICAVSTEDIYPVSTEDGTAAGLRPAAVMSSAGTG